MASQRLTQGSDGLLGWTVVAIGFLSLALAFSARSVLGVAMPVWEAEFGWERTFVSTGGAWALVFMAMVAPFAGNLVDRHGPRALLTVGLAAVGAGMLGVSVMDSRWMFVLSFSGVAALGFGLVATHVVVTAVARQFSSGRGLPTGIATAGATAGQLLIIPLLVVLLQILNWRWSFAVLGAVSILMAVVVALALRQKAASPQARDTQAQHGTDTDAQAESFSRRLGRLLRSPVFHVLFWSFAICGFTTTGVIETHLLPYAVACGFPPLPSATAYGVLSAVNMCGMILAGWLTDRVNRPYLLAGIYIIRGLSFLVLLFVGNDITLLFTFAVIFGLVDYSTVPVTASLAASHLGLRVLGLAMGLISTGHALGAAAGAFLGGWLFDQFARYQETWFIAIGLSLAAGVMVLFLKDHPGAPADTAREEDPSRELEAGLPSRS